MSKAGFCRKTDGKHVIHRYSWDKEHTYNLYYTIELLKHPVIIKCIVDESDTGKKFGAPRRQPKDGNVRRIKIYRQTKNKKKILNFKKIGDIKNIIKKQNLATYDIK